MAGPRHAGGFSGRACHVRVAELRRFLDEAGDRLGGHPDLLPLLADAWDCLRGARGEAMEARKLDRLEEPRWRPPELSFVVERHRGLALGSLYADKQRWTVDLDRWTATPEGAGRRRVKPAAAPLRVTPLADSTAALVARQDWSHPWLAYNAKTRTLRVRVDVVLPSDGVAAWTLSGRRKRYRAALDPQLATLGWVPGSSSWRYVRAAGGADGSE